MSKTLKGILREHRAELCPSCHKRIGWGDISWNNGQTEYGTGYSTVNIICSACDTGIAKINSWYPGIDDNDDVLHVLEDDWQ